MRDVSAWLVPATDAPITPRPASAVPAAHGRAARVVLGLRRRARRRPGHAPLPGAVALDGGGGGRGRLAAPGAAAGRQGLAAAGRGGAGRRGGGHPAGPRPGPAGGRAGHHAAHVRAQQLEARQPRHRRFGPDGRAGLGAAGLRRPAVRPGLVPGDQLPPPAAVQGGLDRGLPGRAGGLRHRHRPWWERQLALCLLGALVQFGWEKALGGYDEELAWWETQAVRAAPLLG